ncbi:MAG: hypothetical protein AMK71_12105 [Nitrospira bacterium SG8_35_4]|nr:MAG: hypothetical protein AMK71_12105 [Nitrospira bacterium SG8_35_4]
MRKGLILALAVICMVGISAVSFAQVSGSVHDLTTLAGVTEICAVCHSPHDSGTNRAANGPLWNHDLSSLTFTMYSSDTAGAEATPSAPGGTSRLCLGCHDGVTALEAFGGGTGSTVVTGNKKIPNLNGTNGNLQGTHPISIAYVASKTGLKSSPSTDLIGNAPIDSVLINGNVECSTCHDVHDDPVEALGAYLLRADNANSAMCLSCHIK